MYRQTGVWMVLIIVSSAVLVQARKPRGFKAKLDSEKGASELIKNALKDTSQENAKHDKAHRKEMVNSLTGSYQNKGPSSDEGTFTTKPMRCPAPCPQSCSSQGCTPGCCAANMPIAPCSQLPGGCGQMFMPVQMPMAPCAQPGGCAPQIPMPYSMPLPMAMPCTQPGGCMPQYQMQMPAPCVPPACIPSMGIAYMPAPPPPMQFTVQMSRPQVFQLPLPQAPMQIAAQSYQQANCNPACATSCLPSCPKTTCCGPLPQMQALASCPQQCAQFCSQECPNSCCGGYQSQLAMQQPMMMPMPLQVQMLPPIVTQLPQQCAPQCQLSCTPMCPKACCSMGKRRR